jgi:hypothetical protein
LNHLGIHHQLKTIFEEHSKKNTASAQNQIITNGFAFSEVDFSADVLICGFNPSMRTDFLKTQNSYTYDLVKNNDRYFKKFEPLITDFSSKFTFSYLDIFYQRHTQQKEIKAFYKNETDLNFLQEQLDLTRSILLEIKPKAILVFNKQAFPFFTWNEKLNLGMKFNLCKTAIPNTFTIIEFDCKLYESRFLNHFVKKDQMQQIKNQISQLLENIN